MSDGVRRVRDGDLRAGDTNATLDTARPGPEDRLCRCAAAGAQQPEEAEDLPLMEREAEIVDALALWVVDVIDRQFVDLEGERLPRAAHWGEHRHRAADHLGHHLIT